VTRRAADVPIGAAFGGLVQSIVNDILMSIIGVIIGGIDFSQMFVQLKGAPAATLEEARKNGATLAYGNFITLLINFLIIAWVLFMVVNGMNRLKRAPAPAAATPPAPTKEEALLTRIRDLLARNELTVGVANGDGVRRSRKETDHGGRLGL
jgi:large conductance mechanosensitive channel